MYNMKNKNNNGLNNLKAKEDNSDYRTLKGEIEKELTHYSKDIWDNKRIYSCTDNPYYSNFCVVFVERFKQYNLKSYTATCYCPTDEGGAFSGSGEDKDKAFLFRITKEDTYILDKNCLKSDGITYDYDKVLKFFPPTELRTDGNAINPLSRDVSYYLEECDIVVTNPPFKDLTKFIGNIRQFDKDFLLICNCQNMGGLWRDIGSGKYYIRPLKENKMYFTFPPRYLVDIFNKVSVGDPDFVGKYEISNDINELYLYPVPYARWITSLKTEKTPVKFEFDSTNDYNYTKDTFIRVHNFKEECLFCVKLNEIPYNYKGFLAVPVNFIDYYNPDQFELIGALDGNRGSIDVNLIKHYPPSEYRYKNSKREHSTKCFLNVKDIEKFRKEVDIEKGDAVVDKKTGDIYKFAYNRLIIRFKNEVK